MKAEELPPGLHRKYLLHHLTDHPNFLGVFEFEKLWWRKFARHYPQSMIILDKKHFTCLVILDRTKCFYFDSCGNENIGANRDLFELAKSLRLRTIVYNAKRIQSSCSDKCGLYCLYFIQQCVHDEKQYQLFLDKFNTNCCFNDTVVKSLLKRKRCLWINKLKKDRSVLFFIFRHNRQWLEI